MLHTLPPEIAFAPLPIRRRGTLEILDTALKLYRRYFGVLIGWSALATVISLALIFIQIGFLLTAPLIFGSVGCCIAAAVRGQKVTFWQIWEFTKPRYGALIGLLLLSVIILIATWIAIIIAGTLIVIAGIYLFAQAPSWLQIVGGVIAYLGALVIYFVMVMASLVWLCTVMFVVCLEDINRGTIALTRAWQLLRGRWRSAFGLAGLLSLASIAFYGIVIGLLVFFGQTSDLLSASPSDGIFYALMMKWAVIMSVFSIFWLPAQAMITAVLYLDLRVHKEALDIEWSAYSSGPKPPPGMAPGAYPTSTPQVELVMPSGASPTGVPPTGEAPPARTPDSFNTPSAFGATGVPTVPPQGASAPPPVDFAPAAPTVVPPQWPPHPVAPSPTPQQQWPPQSPPTPPPAVAPAPIQSTPVPPSAGPPSPAGLPLVMPAGSAPPAPPTPPPVPPSAQPLREQPLPAPASSSFAPPPSASSWDAPPSALTISPFDATTTPPSGIPLAPPPVTPPVTLPEPSSFGAPAFGGSFESSSFGGSSFGAAPPEPSPPPDSPSPGSSSPESPSGPPPSP